MEGITKNPGTATELRKFAWVMAAAFSLFGAIGLFRGGHSFPIVLLSIASLFVFFGLVYPAALAPVFKVWMKFAHILGWINTRLILGAFFYLILTPLSTVMKIARRDLLRRRFDRSGSSYWQTRKPLKAAKDNYEHLY